MPDINLSLNPEDPLIKHAFRGTSFAVVRLEELNEIVNLKADAVACYRPANSQELFAVERIAVCQQAMLRGYRLEAGLFTTALDYCLEHNDRIFRPMTADLVGDGDIEITRAQNRNFAAAEGFRRMSEESDVWSLLIRYQVNADRQYRRAVEDYERVKRLRPEMPHQPVDPKPENIDDDLASFTDLGYSELDRTPPLSPEPPPSGHPQTPPASPVAAEPVTTAPADFTPAALAALTLPVTTTKKFFSGIPAIQPAANRRKTAHRHSESRPPASRPRKAPVYDEVSGLSTAGGVPFPRGAGIPMQRLSSIRGDKRFSVYKKRKETNG